MDLEWNHFNEKATSERLFRKTGVFYVLVIQAEWWPTYTEQVKVNSNQGTIALYTIISHTYLATNMG